MPDRFIYRLHDGEYQVIDIHTGEVRCRYAVGWPAHRGAALRCLRRLREEHPQ